MGIRFPHLHGKMITIYPLLVSGGAAFCLLANIHSLRKVGIWMSESLPESLRYNSSTWFFRAIKCIALAASIWGISQFQWLPLIWQVTALPFFISLALFFGIASLLGTILKWSSGFPWNRTSSFILSLPIWILIPLAAHYLGNTFVLAYRASHADLTQASESAQLPVYVTIQGRLLSLTESLVRIQAAWPVGSTETRTIEVSPSDLNEKQIQSLSAQPHESAVSLHIAQSAIHVLKDDVDNDKNLRSRLRSSDSTVRALALRHLYENPESCGHYTRDVQMALNPKEDKEVVYWAIRAVECANIKPIISLAKLTQIMLDHEDTRARSAAIMAMKDFSKESIHQVTYLLVKRVSENEPKEVVEAASTLLSTLGEDRQQWTIQKLKSLLDTQSVSLAAAHSLITDFQRDDLVADYIAEKLGQSVESHESVINMICLLPKPKRTIANAHVSNIVAVIEDASSTDPGLKALNCLGSAGVEAIRKEVNEPKTLTRSTAARALTLLDDKKPEAVLDTVSSCVRDGNDQVRGWCSQSLGQLGAPALPKIMELLQSDDKSLREAGQNALQFFNDPVAQPQLEKILQENSGWMANKKRLRLAQSIGTALIKIRSTHE